MQGVVIEKEQEFSQIFWARVQGFYMPCYVFVLYKHISGRASIMPMLGLVFVHLCDTLSLNIEFLHFLPLSSPLPGQIWDTVI